MVQYQVKLVKFIVTSFYDNENGNRLVNLLPDHVKSDFNNIQFLDFMDMVGQQFDELWSYIKSISDITDRRLDLTDGFSKDLVFSLLNLWVGLHKMVKIC